MFDNNKINKYKKIIKKIIIIILIVVVVKWLLS